MMNSGAPITGIDRRPLNKAGMDIRLDPFWFSRDWFSGERRDALS
jgi:hypothetical protein